MCEDADEALVASADRLKTLLALSRSLSSSLDLADVLREFSARAAELVGATAAEVSRFDREHDALVMLVDYVGGRAQILPDGGEVYPLADYPATRRVLESGEAMEVRVSNPDDDPAERALLEARGQQSLLMLPLVARGETIGLMEIVDTADRSFAAEDVEFCRAMCDVLAVAIHNAALFAEMQERADRDTLTGVYNRRLFDDELRTALARSDRSGEPLSVLVVDLDDLKRINDTGGHDAGDEALRTLAEALRGSVRAGDTIFRLGGDEFAVVLPAATAEAAQTVAERAQERLGVASGGRYTFSGGVAEATDGGAGQDAYRAADLAAFRAKAEGGARTLAARPDDSR
ncbi:MAG: sensor domain-containing diguanylate cyclase [Actinomycetota bacterium]|nr:sensor domain-containing diguanylate cyclase [Actinomycetota bacterium]